MRILTTLLIAIMPFVAAGQGAGTPQYYDYSGGSNTGSMPLDNSSNKVQWIYGPNAFREGGTTGKFSPQGTVSRIYFKLGAKASDTATYTDFLIRLSQNTGTATSWNNTNWTTGLDTVFYKSSFKITGAKTETWIAIPLQKPFNYNPNLSLVVEISVSAGAGNEVRQNRNSGYDQRKWGTLSSSSAIGYAEGLLNFGLEIKPASINDAGITGLAAPGKFCPGVRNIYLGIKNYGTNQITSLKVNWSLDGVLQTPVTYTNTLDTLDGMGNRGDTILLGSYNFNSSAVSLKAWTSGPNGQTDTANGNDTISVQLQSSGANPYAYTGNTPIKQGIPFNGRLNTGTISDPDGACIDDTVTYIIEPPKGLSNADYGSKWTLSEFYFKTASGYSSTNKTITYPSSSGNGILMFYPKSGDADSLFELKVTIQNPAGGCDSTYSRYIKAYVKPAAAFSVTSPSCRGTLLSFTNNSTKASSIKYLWYFGDGTTSTDTDAKHTYAAAGTYTVSLVAYNDGCSDSIAKSITVEVPPTGADFEPGTPFTGLFYTGSVADPDLVCVNDTLTYELTPPTDFPNSEFGSTWTIVSHSITSTTGSPSSNYTFTAPSASGNGIVVFTPSAVELNQTYILSITIRKQNSICSDTTLTHNIKVNFLPTANFKYSDQCLGQPTYFTDSSIMAPGLVVRKYEFGENGAISTSANTSYTYSQPGEYTVTYTVQGVGGCSDVVKKKITIDKNPIIGFDLPKTICTGNPALFRDTTISNGTSITRHRWSFIEGVSTDTSDQKDATHIFKTGGTHTVKLEIWTDKGCTRTLTKYVFVTYGPRASFSQPVGCLNQDITFTSTSSGSVSYEWRFSDGQIFNTKDITRKFDTAGTYTVTLLATSIEGCTDSITKNIDFYPQPVVDFQVSSECVDQRMNFTDASTVVNGGSIVQWEWIIDDTIKGSANNLVSHTFSDTGLHKVQLKVKTNNGCVDSIAKIFQVRPQPAVDFSLPSSACVGGPTIFVNNTLDSNQTYLWYFGDGKTSTDKDGFHIYSKAGSYNVQLMLTDSTGCSNTVKKTLVVGSGPSAGFDWCVEGQTVFFEAKEKNEFSYKWAFGSGGGTATGVVSSYTYPQTNTDYDVTLTVTNFLGCHVTKMETVIIGQNDNSTITNCKTGIEDAGKSLLRLNIYPNPFSQKTLIAYELPESRQVRVSVWDATGKQIAVLSEGLQQPGKQQVTLDAGKHKLSAGLYMIRIETEGAVAASQVLRLE